MSIKKVFLGGTCNESLWREELISMLEINYFNPVVKDWTPVNMQQEIEERETCDFCLYTITPKMTGVYSIAEVVEDSIKNPEKTIFVILETDNDKVFTMGQIRSLNQVGEMVSRNGGSVFDNLKDAATYMNS